jgi:catechol 2,3-dioxygenase-like lactoylglutathione lyase family enzyme
MLILQPSKPPCLGPALCGTVVVADIDRMIEAYVTYLGMSVVTDTLLSPVIAKAWGKPVLTGRRVVVLGADLKDPTTHWLRLLHDSTAVPPAPMRSGGWLALEILVHDVCSLGERLKNSAFKVLGEPRPLAVSDKIWAMQVTGPAGETLYLTEVRAQVPPFELPPPARHDAERLFIPVLSAPERERTLGYYEQLSGNIALRFETRVAALNTALGVDPEARRHVGTLQLAEKTLIEVDEVPEHPEVVMAGGRLPSGLAMVSFFARRATPLPKGIIWHEVGAANWPALDLVLLEGAAGELIELLAQPSV